MKSLSQETGDQQLLTTNISNEMKECIEKAMKKIGWKKEYINLVLITGGGACIPLVKKMLKDVLETKKNRANSKFDWVSAVANGCAIRAYELSDEMQEMENNRRFEDDD